MTDDNRNFWAEVAAESKAEVTADPLPSIGCSCEPGGVPCPWCSLPEAEREKLRSAQEKSQS